MVSTSRHGRCVFLLCHGSEGKAVSDDTRSGEQHRLLNIPALVISVSAIHGAPFLQSALVGPIEMVLTVSVSLGMCAKLFLGWFSVVHFKELQ